MAITIHNKIEDYTFDEKQQLEQAFKELEIKAQDGELSLEETRIRVAWLRLKREENFEISQPTAKTKAAKPKDKSLDDALAGLTGEVAEKPKRVTKARKKKDEAIVDDAIAKASRLHFMKVRGELLSAEDEQFLANALAAPEVL